MQAIFKITALISIIVLATMICLIVAGVVELEQGFSYLIKTLLIVIVLGAASAVIAVIMGQGKDQ